MIEKKFVDSLGEISRQSGNFRKSLKSDAPSEAAETHEDQLRKYEADMRNHWEEQNYNVLLVERFETETKALRSENDDLKKLIRNREIDVNRLKDELINQTKQLNDQ